MIALIVCVSIMPAQAAQDTSRFEAWKAMKIDWIKRIAKERDKRCPSARTEKQKVAIRLPASPATPSTAHH
jgi:hypothetical protein